MWFDDFIVSRNWIFMALQELIDFVPFVPVTIVLVYMID
jgi:hypothetical protein